MVLGSLNIMKFSLFIILNNNLFDSELNAFFEPGWVVKTYLGVSLTILSV